MNAFEEFMFDENYVLRFYRVDHGLVCTINESMVSELRELEAKLRQQQAEIERLIMLCDCMTTESNRKGNEIEALKKQIPDLENINKPNPFIGNLDKEPHAYKMGDIDWTKALK